MNFTQQKICFRLSKISLLFLYLPFFIVQSFFNFDTPLHSQQAASATINTPIACKQITTSFHSDNTTGHESNIRLNKRFQPESAPVVLPPVFELATYFVRANLYYTYPDPSPASSNLSANKLRGPPAVV